ncbi:polysaccharide deacetylase family protein [Rhizobiales bacterium RZME27]|uniref:Chitooligosaccharide deacetylase n=1 Tax=Endobacterium cereale TaxID=2663029 RepID=A0A6A8AA22_9HYPH|nr:polysaccharide deacetylase family protein [Endobacterium cereale]MEB2847022.1 polysaccharide deacetylase family protein [Endobacterium cereale]MQY47559.1 polysaccharide deacetylase family protein [Endobacterium cereale]
MTGRFDAVWRRSVKRALILGGLEAAAIAARAKIMPSARGCGAIFTLHHVRPPEGHPAEPNAHLDVTPEFLDGAIRRLKADGYEFLSLCDVAARMKLPGSASTKPFAAFTLDDGYRDNVEYALPVFERHGVPFTVFVAKGFATRTHGMWWETLAALLNVMAEIRFDFGAGEITLPLETGTDKLDAFDHFSRFIASGPETEQVAAIDALAARYGIDALAMTAQLTMDVEELRALSQHPLASLGAHTVSHRSIAQLDGQEARQEMLACRDWMEATFGTRPKTFAYPYGTANAVSERDKDLARELGFDLAVTTRPGTIGEALRDRMTALPRISLNGYYQVPRYVSALASGLPFALSAKPRIAGDGKLSPAGEVVG